MNDDLHVSNVTIGKATTSVVTLNDAQLDHVSGGWATAGGTVTATFKGGTPPPVWSVVKNAPGITVGLGTYNGEIPT